MNSLEERLLQALRVAGMATSAVLQDTLGVSQPTISRALAPLLGTGQLLRVGRGRSQAYLMPRFVEGTGPDFFIPIVKIDEAGHPAPFGTLVPVTGGKFWVDEADGPAALHGGLPWFLSDMRPQGFVGRTFASSHAHLGLSPNPAHWNDDDVLKALCSAGHDLPGNLVIGHQAFERLRQSRPHDVTEHEYPALADLALQGGDAGSSAGGDQPKFCVLAAGRSVIVKFSPAGDAPSDVRWRDLLVCEHLALEALAAHGISAARSRVVTGGGRVYLEAERFDRTAKGRVGMVSLMAYDSEYVGKIDNWANTAQRMEARGLLTQRDAATLRFMEAFGTLIGNTDRHYGNVSMLIEKDDWRLAPVYDMLPMVYAPTGGEIVDRPFNPAALIAPVQALRQWSDARQLASRYWAAVARDERISREFRLRASDHVLALNEGSGARRNEP